MGLGYGKVPNRECLFTHRKQGWFLSVSMDDIYVAGRQQTVPPMWKKLMENVDLDEPTSFVNHVYLGRTKPNEHFVSRYREVFEPRISATATEK